MENLVFPLRNLFGRILNFICLLDHVFSSKKNLITDASSKRLHAHLESLDCDRNLVVYFSFDGDRSFDTLPSLRSSLDHRFEIVELSNVEKAAPESCFYFSRSNLGRDLAAQKDFLSILRTIERQFNSVTFINSSMAWSPSRLNHLISSLLEKESVYFPIISRQPSFHFQSYFIFIPKIHISSVSDLYKDSFRNWRFKRSVVYFGEKKLAKNLKHLDVKTQSVVSEQALVESNQQFRSNYNPSLFFGLKMYEAGLFPGIKRVLLATKPFIIE